MQIFSQLKDYCIQLLLKQWKEKEYNCHIKFVVQIAVELATQYHVDWECMHIAWLLHDIGRDQELPGEEHEVAGGRIAKKFLEQLNVDSRDIQCIVWCITNHNSHDSEHSIEEKIIITADSASKILYHQAFMLMCKKESYQERAKRGIKYLEKGIRGIQFDTYREKMQKQYEYYLALYNQVLSSE